jgi:hypothetical protein
MNLASLTRNYDQLSPWERVPLIIAACARGDDSERENLVGSAPKLGFRVPDYWGLTQGLDQLAVLHVLLQLDMAAFYWRISAIMAESPSFRRSKHDRQLEARRDRMLRMIGYRIITEAEAWKLLASELQIDPEELLRPVPGYESMRMAEQAAQYVTYSAEEALEYARAWKERTTATADEAAHPVHVETAADVAASMRKYLEQSVGEWS